MWPLQRTDCFYMARCLTFYLGHWPHGTCISNERHTLRSGDLYVREPYAFPPFFFRRVLARARAEFAAFFIALSAAAVASSPPPSPTPARFFTAEANSASFGRASAGRSISANSRNSWSSRSKFGDSTRDDDDDDDDDAVPFLLPDFEGDPIADSVGLAAGADVGAEDEGCGFGRRSSSRLVSSSLGASDPSPAAACMLNRTLRSAAPPPPPGPTAPPPPPPGPLPGAA